LNKAHARIAGPLITLPSAPRELHAGYPKIAWCARHLKEDRTMVRRDSVAKSSHSRKKLSRSLDGKFTILGEAMRPAIKLQLDQGG
jgi:hypothetical protein